MTRAVRPLADRIFEKVDATGPCWLWTGALNRGGYGIVNRGRRSGVVFVHRAVWEILVGDVPDGHDLDHLCRVRACCNPDHLEPVTRAENVARGAQRAGIPRHTHCVNGHPFTPENTKPARTGRACRTCAVEANRRYRSKESA